jgi:pimeloyl-[acyl-carrier protein] methyl ester esterase
MEGLLLHGWGVRNTVWKELTEQLGVFSKLSAPCLYEEAHKTKDNSFASMASVLNDSINSDTVVIAWSVGGLIGIPLAKLTNKIKAIIFIASTPCFVKKDGWNNVIEKENVDELQSKLSVNTKRTLDYFSGLIAHGDEKPKETNKIIRSNLATEKDNIILASWLEQMLETDQRFAFSKLEIPVEIIFGENDSLINSRIENDIKLLSPDIEIRVMEGCGHAPFISKQQATSKLINEFINAKFD